MRTSSRSSTGSFALASLLAGAAAVASCSRGEAGRYVRHPQTFPSPLPNEPLIGPAHNRLLVSLRQAMGQPDTTFGMTTASGYDGTPLSLVGGLAELQSG